MDKEELAIQRGEEAERLLSNLMFAKAFADTRQGIMEAWASLPSTERAEAKELHLMLKGLDRAKKCIEEHIRTGQITAKAIQGKRSIFPFR